MLIFRGVMEKLMVSGGGLGIAEVLYPVTIPFIFGDPFHIQSNGDSKPPNVPLVE